MSDKQRKSASISAEATPLDTPRTDKHAEEQNAAFMTIPEDRRTWKEWHEWVNHAYNFARQLERELNAANAERNMLDRDARDLSIDRDRLKDELASQSIPPELIEGLRGIQAGLHYPANTPAEREAVDAIDTLLKKYGA